MDRSKRAIKTPKRFNDEAFGPSPKQQPPPKPVEVAKPSPEPAVVTPKNIIKVKLAKPRLFSSSKPDTPTKSVEQTKDVLEPKESPKLKETPKSKEPAAAAAAALVVAKVPREAAARVKEIVKLEKPTKSREPKLKELVRTGAVGRPPKEPRLKENVVKPFKEVVKRERDLVKPKELAKLKDFPKIEIKTPQRDSQLVYRPKTKRPRTPPVYADLIPNVVLPFWDARTAAEDHEDDNVKELVHCHCGIAEELGLMVQCETCLTWQHAHCLGIDRPEDAPDGYTCRACSDPRFSRESMKWAYDQDWLTKGKMKQFPCDPRPMPERTAETLKKINTLIGNALQIHQLIHSLRVKSRILMNANDDDPELKLFKVQWPASYQHRDGTHFIPTITHPSSTPASTISAIADNDTPDPGDITVETVNDVTLPDIGHFDDVTAILESPYVSNTQSMQPMAVNNEITPNDCRANLRLHIQQTEEFIGIELAQIEEQLVALEKEFGKGSNLDTSLESLKNDLQTMRTYITLQKQCESWPNPVQQ